MKKIFLIIFFIICFVLKAQNPLSIGFGMLYYKSALDNIEHNRENYNEEEKEKRVEEEIVLWEVKDFEEVWNNKFVPRHRLMTKNYYFVWDKERAKDYHYLLKQFRKEVNKSRKNVDVENLILVRVVVQQIYGSFKDNIFWFYYEEHK